MEDDEIEIFSSGCEACQQETEEKREANARRVAFIKFPHLLFFFFFQHSKPRHHAGVWTMTLRRMTLEYYNDDGRCKELLEIGWKTEYESLQKIEFLEKERWNGRCSQEVPFYMLHHFRI